MRNTEGQSDGDRRSDIGGQEAKLTQEQLAEKAGTKKSYISKIENAKGNIQLSTLIRIFETGLNRKIGLTFL